VDRPPCLIVSGAAHRAPRGPAEARHGQPTDPGGAGGAGSCPTRGAGLIGVPIRVVTIRRPSRAPRGGARSATGPRTPGGWILPQKL
jgi:hypothetical protein